MSYLELLPAVDVKDGRAVRLVQGELAAETAYGHPLEVALEFQAAGAEWLHLVDLDAAFGRGENSALLAEVVGKLDIKVELSGGIRDDETLRRALATGCTRINLGTAALENPDWTAKIISEHGDRIAVGPQKPSRAACQAVPRIAMMKAAIMVLEWPGSSPCRAPRRIATGT